jgi:hypothetical protein
MSELEEKFVSDDGVSSVPDAVTAAGGEIKKRRGDVKKAVHPKADTVAKPPMAEDADADDAETIEEEIVSIEESIANMFEGMDLSEEFKSKVSLVFEAAVNEAANAKAKSIVEEVEASLQAELEESIDSITEEIVENLDAYLDYVVSEWMKENALAIESGVKVEMAESLMSGLKTLFSEHNIAIDEETIDVVAGLEEQLEEVQHVANDAINENISLAKEIAFLKSEKIFAEVAEGLTVSQSERLKTLSEKLDFEDLDAYKADLNTLKESFFKTKKTQVISEEVEEDEIITEETVKKSVSQYSSVAAIVESLNRKTSK